MPCYITGSELGDREYLAKQDREEAKAAQQVLTELLCEACRYLELHRDIPPMVAKWWNNHKKIDAKRKKRG